MRKPKTSLISSKFNESRGENVVEFAMITPLLLLITFGIIQGFFIFSSWLIITNEARENARYGAVSSGDPARDPTLVSDVQNRVRQRTSGILDQTKLTPTATKGTDQFTVQVTYKVDVFLASLVPGLPNQVPLSAVSTMRTEDASAGGG